MSTPTVTVDVDLIRCAGCDVVAAPIVREARTARDCGRADGNPDRLIATSWSTPAGWGRFTFEDGRGQHVRGDLCAKCVPKVCAELRRTAGYAGFEEPPQ